VGEVEVGRTRGAGMSLPGVGQGVTYFCVWSCALCALSALALVFMLKVVLFPLALAEVMEAVEDRFRLAEVEETMDGN
jgi:hypothetical protein